MATTQGRAPARPLTIVCHLLAAPAAEGRLVGRIDVVSTGDSVNITDVDDLLALLARLADEP